MGDVERGQVIIFHMNNVRKSKGQYTVHLHVHVMNFINSTCLMIEHSYSSRIQGIHLSDNGSMLIMTVNCGCNCIILHISVQTPFKWIGSTTYIFGYNA